VLHRINAMGVRPLAIHRGDVMEVRPLLLKWGVFGTIKQLDPSLYRRASFLFTLRCKAMNLCMWIHMILRGRVI
jgi:hypothetical protein